MNIEAISLSLSVLTYSANSGEDKAIATRRDPLKTMSEKLMMSNR